MKQTGIVLLTFLAVAHTVGADFGQYLQPGDKYALASEKRGELADMAVTGRGPDKRAANALLAFEAFGEAQDNDSYDFTDTKRYAEAAIVPDTNDWISVWAQFVYLAACNMQEDADPQGNLAIAKALIEKISPAAWETKDNPIYRMYTGEERLTAGKLCELVAGFVTGIYCDLKRFDEADAFLVTRPDSRWKQDAATSIRLRRQAHMRFLDAERKKKQDREASESIE